MNLELSEKVAIITGGSKGIGRAIALQLAGEGVQLSLIARTKIDLDNLSDEIFENTKRRPLVISADLNNADEISKAVSQTRKHFNKIDILINNAGSIRTGPFFDISDEQILTDWNLKLLGYIRMSRAVVPHMKEAGGGRIINIIGMFARNPNPETIVAGAANSALVNFTKSFSDLCAPWNILVTGINPALTETNRLEANLEKRAKDSGKSVLELKKMILSGYPMGRMCRPEEVADLACFLASARASFLTGVTIALDGGSTRGVYN